jgi:hypothetical protein
MLLRCFVMSKQRFSNRYSLTPAYDCYRSFYLADRQGLSQPKSLQVIGQVQLNKSDGNFVPDGRKVPGKSEIWFLTATIGLSAS